MAFLKPRLEEPEKVISEDQPQSQNLFCYIKCKMLFLPLCLMSLLCTADALSCYETVNGHTSIKQNDTWRYCSLVPNILHKHDHKNGTRFGLGPENDGVMAYKAAFGLNEKHYKILSVCIYERYDFSRFIGFKPDTAIEFVFRCVCNYDLCNSEATFYPYLKAIREESYVVKK